MKRLLLAIVAAATMPALVHAKEKPIEKLNHTIFEHINGAANGETKAYKELNELLKDKEFAKEVPADVRSAARCMKLLTEFFRKQKNAAALTKMKELHELLEPTMEKRHEKWRDRKDKARVNKMNNKNNNNDNDDNDVEE